MAQKRQRGYKKIEDPEVLKTMLERKQAIQSALQVEENKLNGKLHQLRTRLKRATTYVENVGRKLAMIETYDVSWYSMDRYGHNYFYLERFVTPEEAENEDGSPTMPERGEGMYFELKQRKGKIFYQRERSSEGTLGDAIELYVAEQNIRTYKVTNQTRQLKNLGVLVPNLQLLVTEGNLSSLRHLGEKEIGECNVYPEYNNYRENRKSPTAMFFLHPSEMQWYYLIGVDDR